jgi:hypothetical protein
VELSSSSGQTKNQNGSLCVTAGYQKIKLAELRAQA